MCAKLVYVCMQTTREGQAAYAHVNEIIKGLRARGWSVVLLESNRVTSASSSNEDKQLLNAVRKVFDFAVRQIPLFFMQKPDIIYIRHHFSSIITATWAKCTRTPYIIEVNGPYEDLFIAWPQTKRFKSLFIWMLRTQLRWATHIITVTPQLSEWARLEAKHRRVSTIPNGANTDLFYPQKNDLEGMLYVLFFGTLAPWQGINVILQALDSPDWPTDLHLMIVGDGEMMGKVHLKAKTDHRVIAKGHVPYKDLPKIISGALVSLSVQTNLGNRSSTGLFPLKLFESLACGTPVIVSNFPGMAEFVRDISCGIVVEPENSEEVATAVKSMYEDRLLTSEMSKRGVEEVRRAHSWDARAGETDSILARYLSPGSK